MAIAPAPARAAGKPGGKIRVATSSRPAPSTRSRSTTMAGLQMLLQTGEFLSVSGPDLRLRPLLAESWKPNADGTVWTFKLRQGVKFQNGKEFNADCRGRDHRPAGRSEERVQRAFGLQGHAVQGRHPEGRRLHRRVPSRRAERQLPLPRLLGQLQRHHAAARTMPAISRRTSSAPAPSCWRSTRPRSAPPSCATPTTGASRRCPTAPNGASTQDMQAGVLALQGDEVDIISQVSVQGAQALLERPQDPDHQREDQRPSAGAYAQRHGPLHRQAGAPGHRPVHRPGQAGEGPVPRAVGHRQRQSLRAGLPLDRQDRRPAPPRHRQGQGADGGGRPSPTASR